ncbi:MAG: choice-of-anchor tandem repeat GloVer-containing protein, partial [Chthoniobacteraceae bacterium]
AGLVDDGAGFFWGTTTGGGANNYGTIFKIDASTEALTTVVSFTGVGGSKTGAFPFAALVSDGSGWLWGTTRQGGASNHGTIFKINASTLEFMTQVQFTGTAGISKGDSPFASLANDGNGSVWGTTPNGGANDKGTIFKVNIGTGDLTTLVEFAGNGVGDKGFYPFGGLAGDGAGYFWGTTYGSGGALPPSYGTIFKIDAATGALTTLVEFTGNGASNKGSYPYSGLVSDGAGTFYGTTSYGGANDLGTVFKVSADTGALTTLAEFSGNGANNKGAYPEAGLVGNGPGSFLGTTFQGGAGNFGTVFKVNASTGVVTTLVELSGTGSQANSGSNLAYGSLVKAGDGNVYGTSVNGGLGGGGTVFRVRLPKPVTLPASALTDTAATLNASVNPNGDGAATCSFLLGTDPALAGATLVSAGVVANGSTAAPVSAAVVGLSPTTTYYYCAQAGNAGNPVPQLGAIATFTTPASDTIPPQITNVPANLTVVATSASGAVVNYTPPNAADNVGVTSFTTSKASGDLFPVGLTTVTFTAQDAAGNTAVASFTVTVLTALQAWRQTYFGITTDTGNAADAFDFDHDGLANLVEYAFGLDPTLRSSNQLPPAQRVGNNYVTSFTQPGGVSGVTYSAEWSATMQPLDWHAIPDTGLAPQHIFSVPIGTNPRLFVRLKVMNP